MRNEIFIFMSAYMRLFFFCDNFPFMSIFHNIIRRGGCSVNGIGL